MFAAFRRRAASASRSESNTKENEPTEKSSNNVFLTPNVPTSNPTSTPNSNMLTVNGMKHRTLSGLSINSGSSSFSTSPTLNITRQQEKQELQTLNDRLAVIIDTVRRLEQDNEKLRALLRNNAQSFEIETSKVKTLYENELDEAKKLIEELAHEKSRLEIELEKSRSETQEVQTKALRFERDVRSSENRLKQYEGEIAELKARSEAVHFDAQRRIEENETFSNLNRELEKQIAVLKRQLESETLLRVDLENKNKTLREELQFNQNVYETKISQIKEKQRAEFHHEEGIRQQYDARLLQELQQLRAQNEHEIVSLREEISGQFEKKIEDLQQNNRRQLEQINIYRSDIFNYRERIEETTKIRDVLTEKIVQLEQRCREVEDRNFRSQHQQQEILIQRDEEIQSLKHEIEQMQNEFQILLDAKIGLDREIATYRKLLDSEEERLNIGARLGPSPTPSLNEPSRQRAKRPRFEVDDDVVFVAANGT